MLNNITAVLNDDQGQGLAEYGLILSLVSVACVAALVALAGGINTVLGSIRGDL